MRHQSLSGVLHNFLGAYISRNSDLNGYWLFGFLAEAIQQQEFDLLRPESALDTHPVLASAKRMAVERFDDQMQKAGVDKLIVNKAILRISVLPESRAVEINGQLYPACKIEVEAAVTTSTGRLYQSTKLLFAALHNPKSASRSTRFVL